MTKLYCPRVVVANTLAFLQTAGRQNKECVVLWLALRASSPGDPVCEAYLPLQYARADQFRIPSEGMSAMMTYLRQYKLKLVAQIHSHPREAFHSIADDQWAIVRREGALSIVVPDFATHTTPENFMLDARFYQLSQSDQWFELEDIASAFEVLHDDRA